MKKQKLNYRFHNPNTAEVTANYILKVFIEVNAKKVERVMQEVAEKRNYRFHNPNTAEVTANYILKVFIEVNAKKVERVMQEVAEKSAEEDKQEAK